MINAQLWGHEITKWLCLIVCGGVKGGLMYVRDGANTQYVTSSSFIVVVLADTLAISHGADLMCGNILFSPHDLWAHAKSQVPIFSSQSTHLHFIIIENLNSIEWRSRVKTP